MTQNISNMKTSDVAKAVLRSSKESLEALLAMQRDMAAHMEDIRRVEGELVQRTREAEKAKAAAAEADASAAPATEAAAQTPVVAAQSADAAQAPSASPTPTAEVQAPVPAPPVESEKAHEPAAKKPEQTPQASPPPAPTPKSAPPRMERPAERLARLQGRVLRDDAAIRNAQRQATEGPPRSARPAPRPTGAQGRPAGDRGPRPFAPRDGQGRPQTAGAQRAPAQGQGQGGAVRRRPSGGAPPATEIQRKAKASNYDPNRSSYVRVFDNEKRTKSRKAIERERNALMFGDEEGGTRRRRRKPSVRQARPEPVRIEHAVITGETVTVKTLADRIGKPASDIIKKLMMLGVIASINNEIEFETAALIAGEFGVELEQKLEQTAEDALVASDVEEQDEDLIKRSPVITIMGHVDHGKTSLLDKIRATRVSEGEAGGITQHIGAYRVSYNDHSITFLDTPGHEAFTAMRARGAQVTDAVVLVVAADDGIMPQTVEAINHAKAAEVPIIVAINKMDLPEANPDRVLQELTEHGLVWEEWGGDTVVIRVSAKTGEGIDELLEMIQLATDVLELRANPNRAAKGAIVEAKLDRGRGPVATVLVQNGTLRVGQTVVAGTSSGRIRAMLDDQGQRVEEAGPSMPVEVLGFDFVPLAGDILYAVEDSGLTRQVVEERKNRIKSEQMKMTSRVTLDDLYQQIKEGEIKDLNVIVKADVQGSVEALRSSLEKLSNDQVRVRCIHGGAGSIAVTDVMLASASNAIIIGFNVRPDVPARAAAEKEGVDIRLYRVIYSAIEDIEKAMKGLLEPVFEEVILGRAEVREIFRASAVGTIAGCMVVEGKIMRNADIRLLRDNVVVYEGRLASLKRFKDDAREVLTGYECGISLQNFNDIKQGDTFESYTQQKVEQ